MERNLTLGSLFDGIGGFPLAAAISGITPLWAAEIEPFCIAVTRERFPNMQHLGSVTAINGAEITPVDIITFGSPCQDLSIAGKRAGLDGKRSGLFKEAIRIIYEMRNATNGEYPKYIVWENVPGAFSSNDGNDFKTVLEEITKTSIPIPSSGKWSNAGVVRSSRITAAWRLLDAQYWGVPQRRKRIYLIGSFGSDNAAEILFKCDSVQRYLTPCRTAEKEITSQPRKGVETANRVFDARGNGGGHLSPTITGDHCGHISDYTVIVLEQSAAFLDRAAAEAYSIGYEEEKAPTLRSGIIPSTIYALDRASFNQGANAQYDFEITDSGINSTVVAKGPSAVAYKMLCSLRWVIRRLTPLECERLQGYPDFWTCLKQKETLDGEEFDFWRDIMITDKKTKGKKYNEYPTPAQLARWYNKLECDGNRYKALGNSLAIPCALRVIGYIAKYEAQNQMLKNIKCYRQESLI